MQCFKKLMTEIQNVVPDEAKHCFLSPMDLSVSGETCYRRVGRRARCAPLETSQLSTFHSLKQEGIVSGACEGEEYQGPLRFEGVDVV